MFRKKHASVSPEEISNDGKLGSSGDNLVLDIIHFNDVYNLEPQYTEDPVGGATRFMTLLEKLRSDIISAGRKPMVIFSGDFVGPSLMSSISQGAHLIDAFNLIGVDYATFGNHEFDYGYKSLVNRLNGVDDDVQDESMPFEDYPESSAVWIATNMTETATGLPLGGERAVKSVLVDWSGTNGQVVKVGLLGLSEDWLPACSQLKPDELSYSDLIETARSSARELKAQGAQVVLAATHSRLSTDRELTAAVPEIDLLLGGHDHFYRREREHRIVKGGEEFRWLNHLIIEIPTTTAATTDADADSNGNGNSNGSSSITVHTERYDVYEDIAEHPAMLAVVAKYSALRQQKYHRVLCRTALSLDPTEPAVRFKESALASWICDISAQDYSEAAGLQAADIVMISAFNFAGKQIIPAGDFTLGNLFSIFPRPVTLVVLQLTGLEVVQSLQLGSLSLPAECGGLHHVSSRLSYAVHVPADRTLQNRVADVLFDGKPIDLERVFSVGMTDGMAAGKFGFHWLRTAPRIVDEENAAQLQDIVVMYCNRHQLHAEGAAAVSFAADAEARITIKVMSE